ncbi:chromate resistance protein ChrB domain-containing protein [Polaromonas jejuensis]|uniref:Chromate resistance protein ChrB domain-containing protein n=1 Tax=Polaromonas jejuensis TaxID=457502 RepID=A0ABW0Q582_9BURK|nr:chromate resistance protein ChrB domain-containing protein [Polaromonas jejuensis]
MNQWIALITSLPTETATARMRTWRALKASGAAAIRDGVYLMPERKECRSTLEAVASDIVSAGGSAMLVGMEPPKEGDFVSLFDRGSDYATLLADIGAARADLTLDSAAEALKQARKLSKAFAGVSDIDFFPGEARKQAEAALRELEAAANQFLSPDEPHALDAAIDRRHLKDFKGKTWATRKRPWVDRLASAWLIRRLIDPKAKFLWLESPADCPPKALGFDFDGASFTHVGARVTFEVLLASFGIETPALSRMGALVHYLDVGGVQPAEAAGVESILAGLRTGIEDDDQLMAAACAVFDGLLTNYQQGGPTDQKAKKP